jgi:hypothetical protein
VATEVRILKQVGTLQKAFWKKLENWLTGAIVKYFMKLVRLVVLVVIPASVACSQELRFDIQGRTFERAEWVARKRSRDNPVWLACV